MNCLFCNNKTNNPKFCCRSCSVSYNNKTKPKRTAKIRHCPRCGGQANRGRFEDHLCSSCLKKRKEDLIRNKTIGEYRHRLSVQGKHCSWINSHVRIFARNWNKDLTKSPCRKCGYTKHVELAHIKAVTSFPDTALLKDVNSPENLVPLCPNCHWEFDQGLFKLSALVH